MAEEKKEVFTEIIESELLDAVEKIEEYERSQNAHTEYSEVSDMTENIKEETEKLVRDRKIPERNIINDITTAELAIDLAMANIAKQTAVKLQKLETFLGKIEDKLFNDDILDDMNKGDLLLLYTNTRMMRSDAFKMIREIRKDVDFSTLEANLLSLHAKESIKDATDEEDGMNSLLQSLLSDENFMSTAEQVQKDALGVEENKDD